MLISVDSIYTPRGVLKDVKVIVLKRFILIIQLKVLYFLRNMLISKY